MFLTLHFLVITGHRQAAFLGDRHAVLLEDLRVDEDVRIFLVGRHVRDEQAPVNVDLRRGKADAWRGIHGLEHVVDQRPQLVIDRVDGRRFLA